MLLLVLGEGATLALAGVAAGIVIALALSSWIRTLLFGISAYDPVTFAVVPLAVVVVTLIANLLPARMALHASAAAMLKIE